MSNLNGLRDQLIALRAEQLKAKAESDKAIETIRGLVDNLDTNSLDLLEKYGFYPDFLRNLDVDRLGNDREYLNLFREDLENAIKHLTDELEKVLNV
jgi:Holliday junction resolvase RusA-like endonuclease